MKLDIPKKINKRKNKVSYLANFSTLYVHILFFKKVYRETARNKGWVDLYTPPLYRSSSNTVNTWNGKMTIEGTAEEFIIRAPILDGKNGYYRHLMKVVDIRYILCCVLVSILHI